jgi:hypothetical protein
VIPFRHETDSSYVERVERLKAEVARAEHAARLVGEVWAMGRNAFRSLARLLKPANDDGSDRRAA